ncbi:Protein of unknown function (DUF2459) [Rivularia sp. PCC 7116]|uniref:DUF2459 domain-containing protein n=1 Tax=Rivularia sp. PCC 7116 TaxID=373994 RepID=UPI00029F0DCB|nr:DUF2459 domain-containing protein [Rivularia sp. PCC 7116]AFY54706.1 Protein of unknown function (DUF2459) [Rivularia sp. PCC 7116]
MVFKSLFKYNRQIFGGILIIISLFLIGAFIPRKWGNYSKQACDYQICVANTGIHSNILIPTKNNAYNWHNYLSIDKIGVDAVNDYKYLSFGWGDKDFYMTISSISDFNFHTIFKAVFLPTSSVMYVKGYQSLPQNIEVKCIYTDKANYLQLTKFIEASFKLDRNDRKIRIGDGYTSAAGFYAAKDKYSILRTCNTWTGDGLRKAEINTPLWDSLSFAIMFHLRSGCEQKQ